MAASAAFLSILQRMGLVGKDAAGFNSGLKAAAFTPATAIPDLAGGADLATTVAKVNAILAMLRAQGILA